MADNLLLPISLDRLVDTNGAPLSGAKVFVHDAGTTNLKGVFSDNALSVGAANPIIADAGGYIEPRYIGTGDYKLVITDANDVTIKTADNLTGALATAAFENDEATPVTPAITKSSNYTVQASDKGDVILADATGASMTVTLLSAASAGDGFRVTIKHVGSANAVTVATSGGDTLDGASSFILDAQYESITCLSDGANWHIASEARFIPPTEATGTIKMFGGTSAPTGFALCDGSAISRTTFATLFAVIGTTFGSGDGSTTFNVPDMGGRVPAGKEASATRLTSAAGGVDGATLGAVGGGETHTLTTAQLALHTHGSGSYAAANHTHGPGSGSNFITDSGGSNGTNGGASFNSFDGSDSATAGSGPVTVNGTSGSSGSGDAHPNVQPTIILNYIIKT